MLRRLLASLAVLAAVAPTSAAAAGGDQGHRALARSAAALEGRGVGGLEVTPLLKRVAVAYPSLRGAARDRARRLLARPTRGQAGPSEEAYRVAEHNPPYCSTHFCVHWVDSTTDAPSPADGNGNGVPDYIETVSGVFEHVYDVENNELGWRAPKSDGARGCPGRQAFCMNRTDVYVKDVGGAGVYGYSAPDPGQSSLSQYAYLVVDDDYSARQFRRYGGDPLPPLEVTAAHEYNHVLQFNYDTAQDTWMFEATAVWMEDVVYTDVNDYLQYVRAWARITPVPLTNFDSGDSGDPTNVKAYGDMLWNRWLQAHYGPDVVRDAWAESLRSRPRSFAPGAYDRALRSRGSSFAAAFARFTADTAEWRASGSPFAEGNSFPDVQRAPGVLLRRGQLGASGRLDHTAFFLVRVAATSVPRLKLVLQMPRGTSSALALVGRQGDATNGTATAVVGQMRRGGTGTLVLDAPGRFSRITAVVVNSDTRQAGFSNLFGDWIWRRDGQRLRTRVSTDFTPPRIRSRSPGAERHGVSRRARVRVRFSERLLVLNTRTVTLRDRRGHAVKARLKARGGHSLTLAPRRPLRPHSRYKVTLSSTIRDLGGYALPAGSRSWHFRTRR